MAVIVSFSLSRPRKPDRDNDKSYRYECSASYPEPLKLYGFSGQHSWFRSPHGTYPLGHAVAIAGSTQTATAAIKSMVNCFMLLDPKQTFSLKVVKRTLSN